MGRLGHHKALSQVVLVTLDALGTIYKFSKPFEQQYIEIARQCGLKASLEPRDVSTAFRSAYKSHAAKFPNYGKGKLESPETWWKLLVNQTFEQLVDQHEIPVNLGPALYNHFSSGNAYVLFPDVLPFLQSMREIKSKYVQADGRPCLILGVVSNSDPRVRDVLESLLLKVGNTRCSTIVEQVSELYRNPAKPGKPMLQLQPRQGNVVDNDFDFLTSSYEAAAEKPDGTIFFQALKQADAVMKATSHSQRIVSVVQFEEAGNLEAGPKSYIHIGDDIKTDFEGSKLFGAEALLLDRNDQHLNTDERVGDLVEAVAKIRLMAQENFDSAQKHDVQG